MSVMFCQQFYLNEANTEFTNPKSGSHHNICCINTNIDLHKIGLHNIQYKNDKSAQYISTKNPGGVDLQKKLKIVDIRGAELVVISVIIEPQRRCVNVYTSTGIFTYKPSIITADELICLEAAVCQTTKGSLMFSMEGGCFVTDGIVPTLTAAEQVASTINEADHLLASLTFGVDHNTWKKTTSPVPFYRNPLDVRCELLEAIGQQKKSQEKLSQAYSIYSKFSNVRPWPTLTMGTSAVAVASDQCIKLQGQLLEVDMRGLYTDWLGNQYFDDTAECCIEQEPFLVNFCQQYSSYIQKYPVLSRLEEYATVIGLCLADPHKPVGTRETHKAVKDEHKSDYNDNVHATSHRALIAKKYLVRQEKDPITRVFMSLHLAQSWLGEGNAKQTKDWCLLAIHYLSNISSSNESEILINHLSAKAHLILAHLIGVGSNDLAATHANLIDSKDELEQLLGRSELEHASTDQNIFHKYFVRALETSLQQAIAAGDWSTASTAAEIITTVFCISAGISEVPTIKSIAEQWSHWKTAQYGGLKFPLDEMLNLELLWRAAELTGEVDCTKDIIVRKLISVLQSTKSLTETDAEIQLTGFVHFLYAGMCLQKKDNMPDALHQSLNSSLLALCCFCKPFDSKLPVNWCLLIVAAASYLKSSCKALVEIEEIERIQQCIEETNDAVSKLKFMAENYSTVHLKSVLQNAHKARQIAQNYQLHSLLVHTAEIMLTAYTISGDNEKVLMWKRVLSVDRKNASAAEMDEKLTQLKLRSLLIRIL